MREYREATCKNLLKKPLVLGVPAPGLLGLTLLVATVQTVLPPGKIKDLVSVVFAILGFLVLRIFQHYSSIGWEEEILFKIESLKKNLVSPTPMALTSFDHQILNPDTSDLTDEILSKESLREFVRDLRPGESVSLIGTLNSNGLALMQIKNPEEASLLEIKSKIPFEAFRLYTLVDIPSHTDPRWIYHQLIKLKSPFVGFLRIQGLNPAIAKSRLSGARKRSAQSSSIDEELTFEESSDVLEGIVRGEDEVVECSLVLALPKGSSNPDEKLFHQEKGLDLPLLSVCGARKRFHRSHIVRSVTASDLIPTIFDSAEDGRAILKTRRGANCYFDPEDKRLEALHWLVVGASGSGKSFYTGLMLKRLIEAGSEMSVLILDHNRSFDRMVRSLGGKYLEPVQSAELTIELPEVFRLLDKPASVHGIELSELSYSEKKKAFQLILSEIELYLRKRNSNHPVYVVLDECWQFMKEDPERIQRMFREFRKLNGAAIAITQSIGDLIQDETGSGQAIVQNAPIRILLRQGEDLAPHRGKLGLNDVEVAAVRFLTQKKGQFSECLMKTPFLSRIGRLYPTTAEHELLRTDNFKRKTATVRHD